MKKQNDICGRIYQPFWKSVLQQCYQAGAKNDPGIPSPGFLSTGSITRSRGLPSIHNVRQASPRETGRRGEKLGRLPRCSSFPPPDTSGAAGSCLGLSRSQPPFPMADVITGLIGPEVVLGLEVFHGMKYFVIVLGGDTLVDPRHPFPWLTFSSRARSARSWFLS